jgi:hypothetical protein
MKDALKVLATMCFLVFLAVNALILMVLYVKWVSKMVGVI